MSLDELAEMLGEELELPAIEPKGRKNIISSRDRYVGISRYGPESLRLEDRFTQLVEGKKGLGFPSFKEPLLTKVLCVVEPGRFLPVVKYSAAADGKKEMIHCWTDENHRRDGDGRALQRRLRPRSQARSGKTWRRGSLVQERL